MIVQARRKGIGCPLGKGEEGTWVTYDSGDGGGNTAEAALGWVEGGTEGGCWSGVC